MFLGLGLLRRPSRSTNFLWSGKNQSHHDFVRFLSALSILAHLRHLSIGRHLLVLVQPPFLPTTTLLTSRAPTASHHIPTACVFFRVKSANAGCSSIIYQDPQRCKPGPSGYMCIRGFACLLVLAPHTASPYLWHVLLPSSLFT